MDKKEYIFVGTYTQPILFGTGDILDGKGKGIYFLEMNVETGKLDLKNLTEGIINPSYLCFSPDKQFLYTVNELKEYQGEASGSVSAYKLDQKSGSLTYINTQPTGGTDPCHVITNDAFTHLYVSNFMSGSVSIFPIREDGSIGESSQFIQHEGSSVVKARQSGPHAHSVFFDSKQGHAFIPDLGIDKLMIYKTDFKNGKLIPGSIPYFSVLPGKGPRHGDFHPNFKFCYLINEIDSSISLLYYDEEKGSFTLQQTIETVPENCKEGNTCADLHITPNGEYLFGSNRGYDSIAIYRVNQDDGRLTVVDYVPCGGKTPRNFAIDTTGKFLIVANQDSDNIVAFKIDYAAGSIKKCAELSVPTPVCVKPVEL